VTAWPRGMSEPSPRRDGRIGHALTSRLLQKVGLARAGASRGGVECSRGGVNRLDQTLPKGPVPGSRAQVIGLVEAKSPFRLDIDWTEFGVAPLSCAERKGRESSPRGGRQLVAAFLLRGRSKKI
jgi:hypothetical protein